ncbi:hypothetical protein FJW06_15505 [Mesorhizobium sp. B4-1-3]|uniref:hypothetical protein n=1 Tax=Mesorhizobium sp. B4-1-3 TaxID=2589889 RepID=UPI00112995C3|nr:hypothetical protein [Mesorhizobium sp. B4-1-3]TPI13056.1 hypothetical protein FJW06_15505 [Mesorhizobium sp. B4-1-3]
MALMNIEVEGGDVKGSLRIDTTKEIWDAVTPRAFGLDGGNVKFRDADCLLLGDGAVAALVMIGLRVDSTAGDGGAGSMNDPTGAIPAGEITWRCQ